MKYLDKRNYLSDLYRPASYDADAKRLFHSAAATMLRRLKTELSGLYGEGGIRHNQGGIAVSGEVTLHLEKLYVQVSQPFASRNGVMFRSCDGLKDYTGGPNNFTDFETLCNPSHFARVIQTKVAFTMLRGEPL